MSIRHPSNRRPVTEYMIALSFKTFSPLRPLLFRPILTMTLALAPAVAVENLLLDQQGKLAPSTGVHSVIQLGITFSRYQAASNTVPNKLLVLI
jgi:hypothetical protein